MAYFYSQFLKKCPTLFSLIPKIPREFPPKPPTVRLLTFRLPNTTFHGGINLLQETTQTMIQNQTFPEQLSRSITNCVVVPQSFPMRPKFLLPYWSLYVAQGLPWFSLSPVTKEWLSKELWERSFPDYTPPPHESNWWQAAWTALCRDPVIRGTLSHCTFFSNASIFSTLDTTDASFSLYYPNSETKFCIVGISATMRNLATFAQISLQASK